MSLFAQIGDFMAMSRRPQAAPRDAPQSESRAQQIAELQHALGKANLARDHAEAERLGEQLERLL